MATTALPPQDAAQPAAPAPPAVKPAPTLTPEQIAIVKSTAPVLQQHGVTITTLFYNNMLEAHPELKNIFSLTSQATGAQPRALAASVLAYATYIDDLGKLHHAVERIAHKHASLQIQPAQYDIVGKHLMEAIGQVLGDAATPAIVDAWTNAYGVLAGVFIGREQSLYDEARTRDAGRGWVGWRPFRVVRREAAADDASIVSLYLAPADGRPLPAYEPGQYVSLQLPVPDLGVLQSRQYSLSSQPRPAGDYYRISVKRDAGSAGHAPGHLSNLLHDSLQVGDQVELSQPQGEFVVEEGAAAAAEKAGAESKTEDKVPLVLVSAGVGATPVLAILEAAAAEGRPVSWLHGSHARARLPFAAELRALQQAAPPDQIRTQIFLSEAATDAEAQADAEAQLEAVVRGRRLDLLALDAADRERLLRTADPRTGYYICGPASFMTAARKALEDMGVGSDRIHLELFDTGDL